MEKQKRLNYDGMWNITSIRNGTPIRCGDNLFGEERLCLRCKVVKDLRYSPKP